MARLYQNYGNNKDQCSAFCNRLLKIDPSNEQATFMFANLMLMEAKTEEAINTYIQLLEKDPANFNTLS
jgi:cytochrome c-type biogenesis protein CcmH/NrfG